MRIRLLPLAVALVLGCQPTASPPPATTGPSATPAAAATAPAGSPPASAAPSLAPFLAADLDGVIVARDLAHRLPLAVSIDDNRAARPQSGFNGTSVVWQAPADGYETRYLLIFQEGEASDIGPVRSSRLYQAQWTGEVLGALAHYGGDRLTRWWLDDHRDDLVTDIDGLGKGNGAYHRIKSRAAPHNAYTSTSDLRRVSERLGGAATIDPGVHLRPFRDDLPASERGTSQKITVPYNTVRVGYTYDPDANAYLRTLNGEPHVDPMDRAQVTARTVVVLWMSFRTDPTIEPGHNRPVLGYIGKGRAQVFSEGRVVDATWSKASVAAPTLILGADGEELAFVRGRLFLQVVPKSTDITVRN